jgi:hypothetical protein
VLIGAPTVLRPAAPIALTPGANFPGRYEETRRRFPYLPEMGPLADQLAHLSQVGGGVPVSVDDGRTDWIRFYVDRCCVAVRPTRFGDAFSIAFIEPLNLRNHERLAGSRLRITPPAWFYSPMLNAVPRGCQAPDAAIRRAWRESRPAAPSKPSPNRRHEAFCDALELVVEGARRIELARDKAQLPLPYYEVRSAAEARQSAAGMYVFRLSRAGKVDAGTQVEIAQVPDLRGSVRGVDGDRVTVRFDSTVDRRRIPAQGELIVSGGDIVQRVQRDAITRLRTANTTNPRLMPLLAESAFAPYKLPTGEVEPPGALDDDQRDAFRRALAVPDLLCVLGPPGTGKTTTIVEIARAAAARGERVLIASQTNTAVDNVIERMPAALTAIRVGNEERMTTAVRRRSLGATAAGLREQIRSRTEATAQRLEPWLPERSPARGWLARLESALSGLSQGRETEAAELQAWHAAVAAVHDRAGGPARDSEELRDRIRLETEALSGQLTRLGERWRRLDSRGQRGLLAFLYRWRAGRLRRRLNVAEPQWQQAQLRLDAAERELGTQVDLLRRSVESDASVRGAADRIAVARAALEPMLVGARQAAYEFVRLLAGILPMPDVPSDADGLAALGAWCRAQEPMLHQRARLLRDWRIQLAESGEQLNAELIRYADVIGATCIGVGIQKNQLANLDFDLAIVDEAGQIPLASTLVPLVRARRAVLVGDHHQLPPYVDDDVRQWLSRSPSEAADPAVLSDLLTHSAFERLITSAPQSHQVLLSTQRRMPAVLGDFVSQHFYQGRLHTETRPRPPSPIFRSPLALVNTADRPEGDRRERRHDRTETWQVAGYDNRLEAGLIGDLVQWYTRHERQWAVIAPYRAQVQLLTSRLREMLGDDVVRDRIGTVDTVQGREYDVVVYSLTRSNSAGRVGFLSELRRVNVAITRAREQLVLVGDFSTLTAARDSGFRRLAGQLFAYAGEKGDIVASRDLRDRLA